MQKQKFFAYRPQIHVLFEPLSGMKGLNPRHHLLPFCPKSGHYKQNGNFDPQHSAKLIDVMSGVGEASEALASPPLFGGPHDVLRT